jgi:hypothetical protein
VSLVYIPLDLESVPGGQEKHLKRSVRPLGQSGTAVAGVELGKTSPSPSEGSSELGRAQIQGGEVPTSASLPRVASGLEERPAAGSQPRLFTVKRTQLCISGPGLVALSL